MESLLRTRVGQFELKDSLTLSEIEKQRDDGGLADYILAVDAVFLEYPALTMSLISWSITAIRSTAIRRRETPRRRTARSGSTTARGGLSGFTLWTGRRTY